MCLCKRDLPAHTLIKKWQKAEVGRTGNEAMEELVVSIHNHNVGVSKMANMILLCLNLHLSFLGILVKRTLL